MGKTLNKIQKFFKIAKIINKIIQICAIIAIVSMIFALPVVTMLARSNRELGSIGEQIANILSESFAGASLKDIAYSMYVSFGEIISLFVISTYANKMFKAEIEDGTPFTFKNASNTNTLALLTLTMPISTSIICGIVGQFLFESAKQVTVTTSFNVFVPILLWFLGTVFKYGAEKKS